MKVGSLFSGIGGIDLGFLQAGYSLAWANDNDPDACKTYRHNFINSLLIESDVRKLNATKLPATDVIVAGFPCQPFSVCGKKQGFADERGNLFFEIMRICDALHPSIVFLENVANLTEHDGGRTFSIINNELSRRAYFVRYMVGDACDYGIPQHRTRIYIAAFKSKAAYERMLFPKKRALTQHITDVIDVNVKAPDRYYLEKDSSAYNRLSAAIVDNQQLYRFSDYGIQASKNGISFTLKANMGTWYNRIPFIKDNYGIRKITPSECLALQGFPQDFTFPDIPEQSAYKQCGNSVVVPLIKELATDIQLATRS